MYSLFVSYLGDCSAEEDQIHSGATLYVAYPMLSIPCLLTLRKPLIRCQGRSNADFLLTRCLETNSCAIEIKIQSFSIKEIHLKMFAICLIFFFRCQSFWRNLNGIIILYFQSLFPVWYWHHRESTVWISRLQVLHTEMFEGTSNQCCCSKILIRLWYN